MTHEMASLSQATNVRPPTAVAVLLIVLVCGACAPSSLVPCEVLCERQRDCGPAEGSLDPCIEACVREVEILSEATCRTAMVNVVTCFGTEGTCADFTGYQESLDPMSSFCAGARMQLDTCQ